MVSGESYKNPSWGQSGISSKTHLAADFRPSGFLLRNWSGAELRNTLARPVSLVASAEMMQGRDLGRCF